MCFQAATGFGKTPVILSVLLSLKDHVKRRIIWVVRTGTETDRPIEELKVINESKNKGFFGFSFRGKRDMCLLAREKGLKTYEEVSFLCQKEKGRCKYRKKSFFFKPVKPLLYSEILRLGMDEEVCPYFLQRKLLRYADVVSLSYNYIVSPLGWAIRKEAPFHDSFLVVDEAHNLQFAAGNVNSEKISLRTLERARRELDYIEDGVREGFEKVLDRLETGIEKLAGEIVKDDVSFNPADFLDENRVYEGDLELMQRYGGKIRVLRFKRGEAPRSSMHRLGYFWLKALRNAYKKGIAFLSYREKGTMYIEMWDMRSAEILRDKWREFYRCIYCSGTLKPIKAFAETIGLEKYESIVTPPFYNLDNILSIIVRGVSTRGEELNVEMKDLYLEAIEKFLSSIETNAAIFTASYRVQRGLEEGVKRVAAELGRKIFFEHEGMSGDESREILDEFKGSACQGEPSILVGPMSGRFAEGADFPGRELENIFLVGIPFDRLNNRTKLYIEYYKEIYGERRGRYYSYVVPALRRASQALGRALRSKEDKAVLICGDERYLNPSLKSLLPRYIQETALPLSIQFIKEEIERFKSRISN